MRAEHTQLRAESVSPHTPAMAALIHEPGLHAIVYMPVSTYQSKPVLLWESSPPG